MIQNTKKVSKFTTLYQGCPLHKYKLEKQIGEGSTADIYKCRTKNKQTRVIKFFKYECDQETYELSGTNDIHDEIRIHHRLDHPGVVKLFEFGTEGILKLKDGTKIKRNLYYMVEEYVEADLLSLMQRVGRMDENYARNLFQQIVNAVEYIHNQKICHRDLKLENILINHDLQIKVADFGLAVQGNTSSLTDYAGSRGYMAPEIESLENYDGKEADVFAIGVILFTLVTGLQPFERASISDNNFKMFLSGSKEKFF